ncbi:MAG: zinc-binding dehydrogenase [Chloroflexi bacterium]|nr:MAG: zinc-binding dehydrogenase [Chloroflexota bacterium]
MGSWLESQPLPADQIDRLDVARAVWFRGPREVELRDEEIRSPNPGEVRVRALRSAISHGTEMLVYRGEVDPAMSLDLPTLRGSFAFPIKYGYAAVGRVERIGREVVRLKEGDLVFARHPHQSCFLVHQEGAEPLPSTVDTEAATLLANLETAVNILLDAHPRTGDRVAVFGQGVVGLLVTRLLRRAGMQMIVAVDAIARRRALASALGADLVLKPGDDLAEQVMSATGGSGVDLAVEISGNPSALNLAIDCVRFQGTVVVASWYGTKPVSLRLGGAFHRNRLHIISSQVSHLDPALGPDWTPARRMQLAITLLEELETAPLISHRFPLEEAADAYRLIDKHPDETVQVLFTYV